jgi:hypothetical protein
MGGARATLRPALGLSLWLLAAATLTRSTHLLARPLVQFAKGLRAVLDVGSGPVLSSRARPVMVSQAPPAVTSADCSVRCRFPRRDNRRLWQPALRPPPAPFGRGSAKTRLLGRLLPSTASSGNQVQGPVRPKEIPANSDSFAAMNTRKSVALGVRSQTPVLHAAYIERSWLSRGKAMRGMVVGQAARVRRSSSRA